MFHNFKYILLSVLALTSVESVASPQGQQEAISVCSNAPYSKRHECFNAISPGGISYESARVCGSMPYSMQARCLSEVAGKEISREAAEVCGSMAPNRAIECLSYQRAPVRLMAMGIYDNERGYAEAVNLCRSMSYGRLAECMAVISQQGIYAEGVQMCSQISYDSQKRINCLATIAGKELSHETLRNCATLPTNRQTDCLAVQKRSGSQRMAEILVDFAFPGMGHIHRDNDCYGYGSGHAEAARICGNLPHHLVPQCIGAISGKKFSVAEARVCGNLPHHLVVACLNQIRTRC